jgi:hypothetical protein
MKHRAPAKPALTVIEIAIFFIMGYSLGDLDLRNPLFNLAEPRPWGILLVPNAVVSDGSLLYTKRRCNLSAQPPLSFSARWKVQQSSIPRSLRKAESFLKVS